MALLTIPDPDALILDSLTLNVPDQMQRSIWTSRRKVIGQPGAEMWTATVTIEPVATEIDERPWRAFLFGMKGRQNHIHLPLPCQHHVGGKPLVNNAVSEGYSLPLDGMQPSTTILVAGQFLTVPLPSGHYRTAMLVADLITNSSGEATAQLNVALGETPDDNAVVESGFPFIPMCAADQDATMSWSGAVGGGGLSLEETL